MINRVISALVFGAVAALCLYLGYPWFHALVGLVTLAMGWEWARICGAEGSPPIVGLLMVAGPAAVIFTVAASLWWAVAAVVAVAAALFVAGAASRRRAPAWLSLGVVYVGAPAIAAVFLYDWPPAGAVVVLWVILAVVATDCAAFFVGRAVGGPRLVPRLSPNKTWAGLAGGVAGAALVGLAFGLYYAMETGIALMIAGVVAALIAQIGDLLESTVKRRFGVKDASGLIPGHGGVLDRVDGVVAVMIATAVYLCAVGGTAAPWT